MQVIFWFMKVIFKKKISDFSGHYVLHATPKGSARTSLGPITQEPFSFCAHKLKNCIIKTDRDIDVFGGVITKKSTNPLALLMPGIICRLCQIFIRPIGLTFWRPTLRKSDEREKLFPIVLILCSK